MFNVMWDEVETIHLVQTGGMNNSSWQETSLVILWLHYLELVKAPIRQSGRMQIYPMRINNNNNN